MVVNAFNLHTLEVEENGICEVKASLIYRVSSRPAKDT